METVSEHLKAPLFGVCEHFSVNHGDQGVVSCHCLEFTHLIPYFFTFFFLAAVSNPLVGNVRGRL